MLDLKLIFENTEVGRLARAYRDGKKVSVFGMSEFARAATISLAGEGVTLVVAGDFYLARRLYDSLKLLSAGAVLLPAPADPLVYRDVSGGSATADRLKALGMIAGGKAKFVVTPVDALQSPFPDPEAFGSLTVTVKRGDAIDPTGIAKTLVEAGYRREPQLTDYGRFALRGDILDVWSPAEDYPVRIEFFGDEVESISRIDPETHRSSDALDECFITPVTEFIANEDERKTMIRIVENEISAFNGGADEKAALTRIGGEIISRLAAGDVGEPLSFLLPLTIGTDAFGFTKATGVIYDDAKLVFDNAKIFAEEQSGRFGTLLGRGETFSFARPSGDPFSFCGRAIAFHALTSSNRIFDPEEVFSFRTNLNPPYFRDYRTLVSDVIGYERKGYEIYLAAGEGIGYESVVKTFRDNEIPFNKGCEGKGLHVLAETTGAGSGFDNEKIVVIGTSDLVRKNDKKVIRRRKSDVFGTPEAGDYVVHEVHGVGKMEGIVELSVGGVRHDYALVSYAGKDKLYVPVENMDSLSRYVSTGGEPTLNHIGSGEFARIKERVKKSVSEMAFSLADLYGERLNARGHAYSPDDTLLTEFENGFGHVETEDQLTATAEGIKDLKEGKIMDRLLCGDVGYGKTEVALRIAFKVIAEGKQVAFMSPTTILATQHYETVKARMEPFGVNVGRMTRFDTPAEKAAVIEGLKAGRIDIVVGTHALLGKNVDFADLGLLILDEEQRFGVADKEKIKNLKRGVNVLTLSATPIPRTLHMSLTGIRDISVLDTPPALRLPVQTYVTEYSEQTIVDAVTREINRGGQAFIVYNRVENIEEYTARVRELLPKAKIAFAHGQMRESDLERVVEDFSGGKYDVLVSSTIIENGIDIPRANTMIVADADKLGLSQLYQLRGRVGRSDKLAYVFFTYDGRKTLASAAYDRLEAITQFTELGSGFRIAMRDLEIRGAGSVLGAKQHGHLEKVGYDMYCRLLREAVGERLGKPAETRKEVKAVTDYPVFVPEGYVTDREWRLRIYSHIAKISSKAERDEMFSDLTDIYGPVPDSVRNLVDIALLKNLAGSIGAEKIVLRRREYKAVFASVSDLSPRVLDAAKSDGGRLSANKEISLCFPTPARLLKFLLNCQKTLAQND